MINQLHVLNYDRVWTQIYGNMQHSGPVHRHMKRIVKKLLAQIEYNSILDVGCGPGHNLPLLCQGRKLRRIVGIDISAWAIEQARKTGQGEFYLLDIQQDRLDDCWDLVYCSLVLEHLPEDLSALRNIRAMTGKYLLVTTIAGDFSRYRACDERMGHVRNYQVGELEEKLGKVGFVTQKVVYWGFPFYSPLGRRLQNCFSIDTANCRPPTRFVAELMYYLCFLNSRKRGDLVVALATV